MAVKTINNSYLKIEDPYIGNLRFRWEGGAIWHSNTDKIVNGKYVRKVFSNIILWANFFMCSTMQIHRQTECPYMVKPCNIIYGQTVLQIYGQTLLCAQPCKYIVKRNAHIWSNHAIYGQTISLRKYL